MFEAAELSVDYNKNDYEKNLPKLRLKLFQLQQQIKEANIPVVILIDGIPGAGRGELVNLLNEWMDSRQIINRTFWTETTEEKERPEYWRYWMALPSKGQIGIFFGGWYERPLTMAIEGKIKGARFEQAMTEANKFEQMLTSDGTLIIKLWLHLIKEDHKKRMKIRSSSADPLARDREMPYDEIRKHYAKAIRLTDTANAHWYLINSSSSKYRNITVLETLISNIEKAFEIKKHPPAAAILPITSSQKAYILDSVDLSLSLDKKEYSKELKKYQEELSNLTLLAHSKKLSVVILFEGWDAAGKGGAIRRLTAAIDARIRNTIQVAAPTDEEKAHHYLWRFWRRIPRAGFITIYDRTWYGHVLVERVEGLASTDEWSRAYEEINEFERQLVKGNAIVIKFWLHISRDEQLKRFKDREQSELKRFKITEEDWRNREKADLYDIAINDMFIRTSTDIAPWHIVPGNNKYYARVDVLKTVCKELKNRLKKI